MMNDGGIRSAVIAGAMFLIEHQVRMLPVDPVALATECGWRVKPYTRMADRLALSLSEIIETYGTQDAFTAFRRRPVIFYNDTVRSRERILFSLCHEIGHIALEHFRHGGSLTDDLRRKLDREAHAFACSLMAPAPIVQAVVTAAPDSARQLFGMSQSAWKVRLDTLSRDMVCLGPDHCAKLLVHFDPWLQAMRCRECGALHPGRVCPSCGSIRPLPSAHPEPAERRTLPRKSVPMLEAELDNPML